MLELSLEIDMSGAPLQSAPIQFTYHREAPADELVRLTDQDIDFDYLFDESRIRQMAEFFNLVVADIDRQKLAVAA